MNLTDIEKEFVVAVASGEKFDAEKKIRAEVIRNLYLNGVEISDTGLLAQLGPSSSSPAKVRVTDYGVRLNGATIIGRLNLDRLGRRANYGAPSLHLTNCKFSEGISACNAIIAEIKLSQITFLSPTDSNCTLPPIHLTGTKILGSLKLSDIQGETDETPVWISAEGVEINSGVFIKKSHFFYKPRESLDADDQPNYAIDFNRSIIKGGIRSSSGLICNGGLSILDARIRGSIWLLGSHLTGGEKSALRGQGLWLDGNLLYQPTEDTDGSIHTAVCKGELELFGATVTGGIYLSGLQMMDHPDNKRIDIRKQSINLFNAKIESDLNIGLWNSKKNKAKPFSCSQMIQMSKAKINGDINIISAAIGASKNENNHLTSINASGISIGGNLTLRQQGKPHPLVFDGMLILLRAKIDGGIFAHNITIKDERSAWFFMEQAQILGQLNIQEWDNAISINFSGSEIKGACVIKFKKTSNDDQSKPSSNKVNLSNTKFESSLSNKVNLSNTKFESSLSIKGNVFSLELDDAVIKSHVELDILVSDKVQLNRAKIAGNLNLEELRFQIPLEGVDKSNKHFLGLKGANIGGNLKVFMPSQLEDVSDILITNACSKELICYPGWTLVEVEVSHSNEVWYASFLEASKDNEHSSGFYLCDGQSLVFHQLNGANQENRNSQLDISTEEAAIEYIKLFCAFTWGDEGAFAITENSDHIKPGSIDMLKTNETEDLAKFNLQEIVPVESLPLNTATNTVDEKERLPSSGEEYRFKVFMRYSNFLFMSILSLSKEGKVEMLDDELKLVFFEEKTPMYKLPLRQKSEFFTCRSDFSSNQKKEMMPLPREKLEEIEGSIKRLIKYGLPMQSFSNATIDLSEASVMWLDDDDGAAWGEDVRELKLMNFHYQRYCIDPRTKPEQEEDKLKLTSEPEFQSESESESESILGFIKRLGKNTVANIMFYLALQLLILGYASQAKKITQSKWTKKTHKPEIRNRIHKRLHWLELQYPKHSEISPKRSIRYWAKKTPIIKFFLPNRRFNINRYESQPYSQAAAVFRKEGASEHARKIDLKQRKFDGQKYMRHADHWNRPFLWLFNGIFNLTSGYGLRPIRTLSITMCIIVGGGLMTSVANHKGLLIVDALPVVQGAKDIKGTPGELSYSTAPIGWRAGEVFCGESIEPILYATDIFIPLLDLRQEIRCMIRPANSLFDHSLMAPIEEDGIWKLLVKFLEPIVTDDVNTWHWMRSIYTIIGWIMVSLLIYTLSHSLRSKDSTS